MLSGRKTEASPALKDLLNSCTKDPVPTMQERLKKFSEIFTDQYSTKKGDNQPGLHVEFAHYRSQLGQTLYYRLLESILSHEVKLRSDKVELTVKFIFIS